MKKILGAVLAVCLFGGVVSAQEIVFDDSYFQDKMLQIETIEREMASILNAPPVVYKGVTVRINYLPDMVDGKEDLLLKEFKYIRYCNMPSDMKDNDIAFYKSAEFPGVTHLLVANFVSESNRSFKYMFITDDDVSTLAEIKKCDIPSRYTVPGEYGKGGGQPVKPAAPVKTDGGSSYVVPGEYGKGGGQPVKPAPANNGAYLNKGGETGVNYSIAPELRRYEASLNYSMDPALQYEEEYDTLYYKQGNAGMTRSGFKPYSRNPETESADGYGGYSSNPEVWEGNEYGDLPEYIQIKLKK